MALSKTTVWRRANPIAAALHRARENARWHSDPVVRERHKQDNAEYRRRLKAEVFDAYGGPICVCCGETVMQFLTLDHIYNNGAEERAILGHHGYGSAFYSLLKRSGYPPGYQVLCMNCNFAKGHYGECPHVGGRL